MNPDLELEPTSGEYTEEDKSVIEERLAQITSVGGEEPLSEEEELARRLAQVTRDQF